MRLAAFAGIAMGAMLSSAQVQADSLSLSWSDPAPDGAEAVVSLRNPMGQVLFSLREQVPVGAQAQDIALPPLPRAVEGVQAGLVHQGRVIVQSAILPLARGNGTDMPATLSAQLAAGLAEHWECENAPDLRLYFREAGPVLQRLGEELALMAVADQPGAFVSDDATRFERNGNRAVLTPPDSAPEQCAAALFPPILPLTAKGMNAAWRVDMQRDSAELDVPGLQDDALSTTGLRLIAPRDGTLLLQGDSFGLRISDAPCHLLGTDLIYPFHARLLGTDPELTPEGCAGDPLALLSGAPWDVQSIFGIALEAGPGRALTLEVTRAQVSGRGTCNRYLGSAAIENGQLAFRDLGTTRLSCPADLRALELRFLDALEAATGFDITPSGQLTLRAGVLPVLTARQQPVN